MYYALIAGAGFIGYASGLLLVVKVLPVFDSQLLAMIIAILVLVGLSALAGLIMLRFARRIYVRLLASRYQAFDRAIAVPAKGIISITAVAVLTQTLVFAPVAPLQFIAQGSTILFAAHKVVPQAEAVQSYLQRANPDQYTRNYIDRSSTNTINQLEHALDTAAQAAPSVVRVSGPICAVGEATGSGFVVTSGYIVTNAHVIRHLREVYVSDAHGSYPATPLVVDQENDIAILYSRHASLPALPVASQNAALGTKAVIMGYPGGGNLTVDDTAEVTGYDRGTNVAYARGDTEITRMVLRGTIAPGNSGGPVLDGDGSVLGVIFAEERGGSAQALALPVETLLPLIHQAKHTFVPARFGC